MRRRDRDLRTQSWTKPAIGPLNMSIAEADAVPLVAESSAGGAVHRRQRARDHHSASAHARADSRPANDQGRRGTSRPIYFSRTSGGYASELGMGQYTLTQGLAKKLVNGESIRRVIRSRSEARASSTCSGRRRSGTASSGDEVDCQTLRLGRPAVGRHSVPLRLDGRDPLRGAAESWRAAGGAEGHERSAGGSKGDASRRSPRALRADRARGEPVRWQSAARIEVPLAPKNAPPVTPKQ